MLFTWFPTVLGVIAHARATSLVLRPLAIQTRIWRSRRLRAVGALPSLPRLRGRVRVAVGALSSLPRLRGRVRVGAAFSTDSINSGSRYAPDWYSSAIASCSVSREARRERYPCERAPAKIDGDRKSTRLNSSHVRISYAVFCLK